MKWPIRYVTNDLGLLLMYAMVWTSCERKFSPLTMASKNSNNNFWLATTFAILRPVLNQFQNWEFKDSGFTWERFPRAQYLIITSGKVRFSAETSMLSTFACIWFSQMKVIDTIIFSNLVATFNYRNFLGIRSAMFRKFTIASYNSVFLL